jgi:hypothetical protein
MSSEERLNEAKRVIAMHYQRKFAKGLIEYAPDLEEVMEQMEEMGGCDAVDGCWVEPDGYCEHGEPSWMIVMGLI